MHRRRKAQKLWPHSGPAARHSCSALTRGTGTDTAHNWSNLRTVHATDIVWEPKFAPHSLKSSTPPPIWWWTRTNSVVFCMHGWMNYGRWGCLLLATTGRILGAAVALKIHVTTYGENQTRLNYRLLWLPTSNRASLWQGTKNNFYDLTTAYGNGIVFALSTIFFFLKKWRS